MNKGVVEERPWMMVEYSFLERNYLDSIVWGIGNTNHYFIIEDVYSGEVDGNEGGAFRCFNSENYTYKKVDGNCDYDFTIQTKEHIYKIINIYPNPVTSTLYIENLDKLKGKNFSIVNLAGQALIDNVVTSEQIDVTTCPPGVYFLRIGSAIERFIKY